MAQKHATEERMILIILFKICQSLRFPFEFKRHCYLIVHVIPVGGTVHIGVKKTYGKKHFICNCKFTTRMMPVVTDSGAALYTSQNYNILIL